MKLNLGKKKQENNDIDLGKTTLFKLDDFADNSGVPNTIPTNNMSNPTSIPNPNNSTDMANFPPINNVQNTNTKSISDINVDAKPKFKINFKAIIAPLAVILVVGLVVGGVKLYHNHLGKKYFDMAVNDFVALDFQFEQDNGYETSYHIDDDEYYKITNIDDALLSHYTPDFYDDLLMEMDIMLDNDSYYLKALHNSALYSSIIDSKVSYKGKKDKNYNYEIKVDYCMNSENDELDPGKCEESDIFEADMEMKIRKENGKWRISYIKFPESAVAAYYGDDYEDDSDDEIIEPEEEDRDEDA